MEHSFFSAVSCLEDRPIVMVWGHGAVLAFRLTGSTGGSGSMDGALRFRGDDHVPVKSVLMFSK